MVLSDGQFGTLYHGTGAELAPGDTVEARPHPFRSEPAAFASKHEEMARPYAQYVTQGPGQQAMLGHVYEVEPVDPDEVRHREHESVSSKGFKVKRHISSHPILGEAD